MYPGIYEPFDVVTSRAVEHALAEHGLKYDERKIVEIMAAYNRLHEYVISSLKSIFSILTLRCRFDDAVPAMKKLRKLPNIDIVIFSNGAFDKLPR